MTDIQKRVHDYCLEHGVEARLYENLTHDECVVFASTLESITRGESSLVHDLWKEDYNEIPVSIEQFITDKHYLGIGCQGLYPKWRELLLIVLAEDSKYFELILSGAIGVGKSTCANIATAYKLYRVLCLKTPVEYYDLMGGGLTQLAFAFFNVSVELAYKVNYQQFKALLLSSPWFADKVKENRTGSMISIKEQVNLVMGSQSIHAIGQAVIGAQLDEADFKPGGGGNAYGRIYETYYAIYRRMESRFIKHIYKAPPGLLILISSTVQDDASFLNAQIERAKEHPDRSYIASFASWEVKPVPKEFDTGWFPIFIGDDLNSPKIITEEEKKLYQEDRVLMVPNFYRNNFETDIDRSILDLAGVRTGSRINLWLREIAYYRECIERHRGVHPFKMETIVSTISDSTPISEYFIKDIMFTYVTTGWDRWTPRINPKAERYLHVDLSATGDKTGIACVHMDGYEKIEMEVDNPETGSTKTKTFYKPRFYTDFLIRISSKPGSEIDFSKIRDFFIFLSTHGLVFGGITYDAFQSRDSIQILKGVFPYIEKEIRVQSVDRTGEPYQVLREIIIQGRHSVYSYAPLTEEVSKLLRDSTTGKVDHPQINGSKDVSDGWCGATYNCAEHYKPLESPPLGLIRSLPLQSPTDDTAESYMKLDKPSKPKVRI